MRTAFWCALRVQLDDPPHMIEDEIGLAMADPDDGWRDRLSCFPLELANSAAARS